NRRLSPRTYLMRLSGAEGVITAPGQFVNLAVEGKFLRRPISVCGVDNDSISLLYDVVGEGTAEMARWHEGYEADVLAPLGNGFDTTRSGGSPLLLGGGIGVAPLYQLARDLVSEGKNPVVILGFNTAEDVVWLEEFRATGAEVYVATVNGTSGTKGFVTDVAECRDARHGYFYACGPLPMLRALCKTLEIPGELSLEARMACGFGVCMCCSLETADGAKRICKDGPVFRKEELIWK
ncbi:MAG: dihydroorotate dehydrogenase electron transfer subunit, partial [Muribaculaceae bacterium]|nr:dihydroorotate dehydrogenase electron transfer subunit [Muribaculaceae bacterium]